MGGCRGLDEESGKKRRRKLDEEKIEILRANSFLALSQVLSFSFMMEWHISGTAQSDSIRIQSYILTPLSILVCTAGYIVNQYFKTMNMKLWFCPAKRGEAASCFDDERGFS